MGVTGGKVFGSSRSLFSVRHLYYLSTVTACSLPALVALSIMPKFNTLADIPCFPANPDISGIGVRTAIYAQNILSFVPALFALLNDGKVTPVELEGLETQSRTILITAFAILLSAIIQACSLNGITDYHASIVLNLSWMNNTNLFIYLMLYIHYRVHLPLDELEEEGYTYSHNLGRGIEAQIGHPDAWPRSRWAHELRQASQKIVIIIGSLHLSLMAVVGVWLWSSPVQFGTSGPCSLSASLTVLGGQIILDTEVTIARNSGFVANGETLWTFGQTLALLLLLVPLYDIGEAVIEYRTVDLGKKLINAAKDGDIGVIQYALQRGVRKGDIGKWNWTYMSLHKAVECNQLEYAQLLIKYNADVNAQNEFKITPLHKAAEKGHLNCAQLLIKNNADVNAKDEDNNTPLHKAAQQGHLECAELLMKYNADVDAQNNDKYYTALHTAAEEDMHKITPLHKAAQKGNLDCAQLLITHNANVNAYVLDESKKNTPLHEAAHYGHIDCMQLLITHKADVNAQNEWKSTPLHSAALHGHVMCAYFLLQHNANVDAKDCWKSTPLHTAVDQGRSEYAELLIKFNADVNAQDEKGNTPLHKAAGNGFIDCVDLLINYNAEVNAPNKEKTTPLHKAAEKGHIECVQFLIKHNADINAQDEWGETPLSEATSGDYTELIQLLLQHNVNINAQNMEKDTPLHKAEIK
ncbi:hypothetical protein H0H92_007883 [Tricholoma furcatifolium]|nr:hypothetical protein H0H92_007883 [Tricholoma furcatifolium]